MLKKTFQNHSKEQFQTFYRSQENRTKTFSLKILIIVCLYNFSLVPLVNEFCFVKVDILLLCRPLLEQNFTRIHMHESFGTI